MLYSRSANFGINAFWQIDWNSSNVINLEWYLDPSSFLAVGLIVLDEFLAVLFASRNRIKSLNRAEV